MISLINLDTLAGGRYLAKRIETISSYVAIVSLGKE